MNYKLATFVATCSVLIIHTCTLMGYFGIFKSFFHFAVPLFLLIFADTYNVKKFKFTFFRISMNVLIYEIALIVVGYGFDGFINSYIQLYFAALTVGFYFSAMIIPPSVELNLRTNIKKFILVFVTTFLFGILFIYYGIFDSGIPRNLGIFIFIPYWIYLYGNFKFKVSNIQMLLATVIYIILLKGNTIYVTNYFSPNIYIYSLILYNWLLNLKYNPPSLFRYISFEMYTFQMFFISFGTGLVKVGSFIFFDILAAYIYRTCIKYAFNMLQVKKKEFYE